MNRMLYHMISSLKLIFQCVGLMGRSRLLTLIGVYRVQFPSFFIGENFTYFFAIRLLITLATRSNLLNSLAL